MEFLFGTVHSISYAIDPLEYDNIIINFELPQVAQLPIPVIHSSNVNDMPKIGDKILILKTCKNDYYRIIKTWSTDVSLVRAGEDALNEGEIHIQSVSGRGYLYLDAIGNVITTDGSMKDSVSILQNTSTIKLEASNLLCNILTGSSLSINSGNELNFIVNNNTSKTSYGLTIDKDLNTTITTDQYKIKLDKDGNIFMDGKNVFIGSKAIDAKPENAGVDVKFGDCVTGGQYGTHPICFFTGKLITGSTTVKVANNE